MNQRVFVILTLALVISAGASYFVYRAVVSRAAGSSTVGTVQVVVATKDLEIGALIKPGDLKMGAWTGPVPKGMAVKMDGLAGRGVVAAINAGEPVFENRLAPEGAGGGLAATIPAGMRACAVRVNDIVGVAGFVVPGMRVDVLITGTPSGSSSRGSDTKVKTLLQNILVLSAGQNYQKDAEGKPVVVPVVNLLVTPEQAEVLSLASNETRIQLVLRNPLDRQLAKTNGSGLTALFGESQPAAAAPRPRPRTVVAAVKKEPEKAPPTVITLPPYQIQVINGAKQTEIKFARPQEEQQ